MRGVGTKYKREEMKIGLFKSFKNVLLSLLSVGISSILQSCL